MRFDQPWIGVDLDGTLARHEPGWHDWTKIGDPVPVMVARVNRWLAEGKQVRVLTARVARGMPQRAEIEQAIRKWTAEHVGRELDVTSEKDPNMTALWDDRAVRVVLNTGLISQQSEVEGF